MTSSSPSDGPAAREQALTEFAARSREARRRANLDRATADLIDELGDAGVEVLLLKGAALAQALYAPDRERGYYDVDLLVAPEDRPIAEDVLARLGYRNITSDQGIEDVAGILHAELWTRRDEVGNVSIDLHWRLAGCDASEQKIWQSLRADAQIIHVERREVLTPGDAGLALHSALHVAQHGTPDVKAVADLKLGLARWPIDVWEKAADLARELDGLEAFTAGIRLVPEGDAVARLLELGSGDRVLRDLQLRGARPRGTFHLDALTRAATMRDRLTVLRLALIPPPNWIRWEMRWAADGKAQLAAGYLLHLARAPLWAARAIRFSRQPRR